MHRVQLRFQTGCTAWPVHTACWKPVCASASADASFRRYFRVDSASGASFIIMDAPPDKEDCPPFVKVAGLMADAGLKAPHVLAWDEPQGFMLLTDLGAQTMMDVIDPDVSRTPISPVHAGGGRADRLATGLQTRRAAAL